VPQPQYVQPQTPQHQQTSPSTQGDGNLPPFTDPKFLETQNEISKKMFEMVSSKIFNLFHFILFWDYTQLSTHGFCPPKNFFFNHKCFCVG
jgi:hypothetical protein